jgi:hypothetical protein
MTANHLELSRTLTANMVLISTGHHRMHPQQDTSNPAKGKRGNKKGKRGREPTIVIVFFHITTIVGESSQKLNKISKTFRQDVAFT